MYSFQFVSISWACPIDLASGIIKLRLLPHTRVFTWSHTWDGWITRSGHGVWTSDIEDHITCRLILVCNEKTEVHHLFCCGGISIPEGARSFLQKIQGPGCTKILKISGDFLQLPFAFRWLFYKNVKIQSLYGSLKKRSFDQLPVKGASTVEICSSLTSSADVPLLLVNRPIFMQPGPRSCF